MAVKFTMGQPVATAGVNGLVRVMDETTGQLKRWETTRGKPMAVIENGSLVLTRVGRCMGYKVRDKKIVKT